MSWTVHWWQVLFSMINRKIDSSQYLPKKGPAVSPPFGVHFQIIDRLTTISVFDVPICTWYNYLTAEHLRCLYNIAMAVDYLIDINRDSLQFENVLQKIRSLNILSTEMLWAINDGYLFYRVHKGNTRLRNRCLQLRDTMVLYFLSYVVFFVNVHVKQGN